MSAGNLGGNESRAVPAGSSRSSSRDSSRNRDLNCIENVTVGSSAVGTRRRELSDDVLRKKMSSMLEEYLSSHDAKVRITECTNLFLINCRCTHFLVVGNGAQITFFTSLFAGSDDLLEGAGFDASHEHVRQLRCRSCS